MLTTNTEAFIVAFKKEIEPFLQTLAEQAIADENTTSDRQKFFSGRYRGASEMLARLEEFYEDQKAGMWDKLGDLDV